MYKMVRKLAGFGEKKMKKPFKIKKPKSNINGNCIIMFLLMVGLSSLAYAISVILAMIFIDGMFHWLLIFLFHFVAIFFIPPSLIISVLAYLLKLKKGFLNGIIIGLMYATLVVGGVAFIFIGITVHQPSTKKALLCFM